jgi:hypothetical protein
MWIFFCVEFCVYFWGGEGEEEVSVAGGSVGYRKEEEGKYHVIVNCT